MELNITNSLSAQDFFHSEIGFYNTNKLQTDANPHSLWKLRKPFTQQSYRLLRHKRHASIAKELLSYFLTICDNDTGVVDISVETLASDLGCSPRYIKYGTQLLSEQGIIDIKQRGYMRNNLYILNIETLGTRPITYEVHTMCTHSTNNKNIEEKIILECKRKWIEPEPLPPDLDFSEQEKDIIAKTYHVDPEMVNEALKEWHQYNEGRMGFHWLKSFNGFCARRKWYKQSFKRPRRFVPINPQITIQSPLQAQVCAKTAHTAEKMKSYRKPRPQKLSNPDKMELIRIEIEADKAYLMAGIINPNERKQMVDQLLKQTFYGYKRE